MIIIIGPGLQLLYQQSVMLRIHCRGSFSAQPQLLGYQPHVHMHMHVCVKSCDFCEGSPRTYDFHHHQLLLFLKLHIILQKDMHYDAWSNTKSLCTLHDIIIQCLYCTPMQIVAMSGTQLPANNTYYCNCIIQQATCAVPWYTKIMHRLELTGCMHGDHY